MENGKRGRALGFASLGSESSRGSPDFRLVERELIVCRADSTQTGINRCFNKLPPRCTQSEMHLRQRSLLGDANGEASRGASNRRVSQSPWSRQRVAVSEWSADDERWTRAKQLLAV